jgi:DNA-binding MarR family transcriptional regulator
MENNSENINRAFHRIFNLAISKELVPRTLPTGEKLFRIEIHVIVAIFENPGINLTTLADILSVTKGAVSQKVKILEKKEYLKRVKINNKEITFELTCKGEEIFNWHTEFHNRIGEHIKKELGDIQLKDMELIMKIMKVMENHFNSL